MNRLCPQAAPVAVSALAAALYEQLDPAEVGVVASVLVHLGESLGLIAAVRNAECGGAAESAAVRAGESL